MDHRSRRGLRWRRPSCSGWARPPDQRLERWVYRSRPRLAQVYPSRRRRRLLGYRWPGLDPVPVYRSGVRRQVRACPLRWADAGTGVSVIAVAGASVAVGVAPAGAVWAIPVLVDAT